MNKNTIYISFIFIIILFITACQIKTNKDKYKSIVICSNEISYDLVHHIGGDFIEVRIAMREGNDPHSYKATEKDIIRISDSSLIVYNGSSLEGRLEWALNKIGNITPAISITKLIPEDKLIYSKIHPKQVNPHFWQNVKLWQYVSVMLTDKLVEISPVNEPIYRKNEEIYLYSLEELDKYIAKKAASIPKNKRFLVTEHDSFAYFGKAYGFETLSLQDIDTSEEISQVKIDRLADTIISKKIDTIFFEATLDTRNILSLQSTLLAKGHKVKIGGTLYSDTLLKNQGYEETMIYNINTITKALTK